MMRVLLVLLALSVCVLSHLDNLQEKSAGEPHVVRDVVDTTGAVVINGTINGRLEAGETKSYVLFVDAQQVVDFSIAYDEKNNAVYGLLDIFQGGTTTKYQFAGNVNLTNTLASHCPEYATKYYFQVLASDEASNFTLYISYRSSNHIAGASFYSAAVLFPEFGYIGFPITTQCQQLVIDLRLSYSNPYHIDLLYKCRVYDESCERAYLPVQPTYESYNQTTLDHYQYIVNCTSEGTYYLYLRTGSLLTYNVTMNNGYTCPKGCWEGGVCDVASATCICNVGFQGYNCSAIVPNTPSGPTNITVIDLFADGTTNNISNATSPDVNSVFQLNFTPSRTKTLRLRFFISNLVEDFVNIVAFFNLKAVATPSNHTVYTIFYDSNNVSREAHLCATSGPWYFYLIRESFQDVLLTADMVDVPVITGTTFSGVTPITQTQDSVNPVIYMFQPTSSSVTIQVNETYPLLSGLYLARSCSIFADPNFSSRFWINADRYEGTSRFQVSSASANTTLNYYVVVMGVPGANYTGTILYNAPGTCQGSCSGGDHGFCSPGSYCVCRKGYSGGNCSVMSLPAGSVQLSDTQSTTLHLPSGPFYETIVYALAPLIPAGYSMVMSASANVSARGFLDKGFPFVTTYGNASMSLSNKGTIQKNYLDGCVVREATQWYVAFVPENEIGGDVNVSFTLTQSTLPSDGTTTTRTLPAGLNALQARLPASCSGAYYVSIQTDGGSNYIEVGEGRTTCFSVSSFHMENAGRNNYSYLVPIVNCTSFIDLTIDASDIVTANITISPTTPCPNNCSQNGKCRVGGKCECNYPFLGLDCGTYDTVCTVLPDNGTCNSDAPSVYSQDPFGDASKDYCSVQLHSHYVEGQLRTVNSYLEYQGIYLNNSCSHEIQQIMCDGAKYKCQTQEGAGGGVKFMLPCNGRTWLQRCAPAYTGNFYYLTYVITDVSNRLQQFPSLYICNPNPFNASLYPDIPTPAPTSFPPSGPTTSKHTSSSSATSCVVHLPFLAVALVVLLFVI